MNLELLNLAEEALAQIAPLTTAGWAPAESIARQLRWCIGFAAELPCEVRPGPFTMGLIATREFDMYGNQPDLAALINKVQSEAERALA